MWTEKPVQLVGEEIGGFKKFLLRGNVVDLAVGVVIGAAFGNVVQAVVKDVLNPLIGMFGGTSSLSDYAVSVGSAQFMIGDLINALIAFLLVATVVYFIVFVPVNRLRDKFMPEPQPAPTKECPECLSRVPKRARRCPHCTSELTVDAAPSRQAA